MGKVGSWSWEGKKDRLQDRDARYRLVYGLERARNRLALAAAVLSKCTPPDARHRFVETDARIRRVTRSLREGHDGPGPDPALCLEVLEALDGTQPAGSLAGLCSILEETLDRLKPSLPQEQG